METLVKISPQEYFEQLAKSEVKLEYHAGEVVAMAGASRNHNILVSNFIFELNNCLRYKKCSIFPSDMLVKLSKCKKYVFPDVTIVCEEEKYEKCKGLDVLLNPTIIIEVLSTSTSAYDSNEKMECYFTLESLQEYWLVDSESVSVKSYKRTTENDWILHLSKNPDEVLKIGECEALLKDIYLKTDLL
jgi:Uma2 family endonuclease